MTPLLLPFPSSVDIMNRRELLKRTAALGVAAGIPSLLAGKLFAGTDGVQAKSAIDETKAVSNPLTPPAQGSIPVAFPISEGVVIIDFCGPWGSRMSKSTAARCLHSSLYRGRDKDRSLQAGG